MRFILINSIKFFPLNRQMMQDQGYDLFASVRQCGGPHTLTVPHKKLLKIPQPLVVEEATTPVIPSSAKK